MGEKREGDLLRWLRSHRPLTALSTVSLLKALRQRIAIPHLAMYAGCACCMSAAKKRWPGFLVYLSKGCHDKVLCFLRYRGVRHCSGQGTEGVLSHAEPTSHVGNTFLFANSTFFCLLFDLGRSIVREICFLRSAGCAHRLWKEYIGCLGVWSLRLRHSYEVFTWATATVLKQ